MSLLQQKYTHAIQAAEYVLRTGKVLNYHGLVVESLGPEVSLGELCEIYSPQHAAPVRCEVVGFRAGSVLLMPYGDVRGIKPGSEVLATGRTPNVQVGEWLLGRVLDAFGRPLDGSAVPSGTERASLYASPINPITRSRIDQVFETGIASVDALLTVGVGQRMGIFAGSGVGKSSLLGMIAQNSEADVNVVALIGERSREVREFIEDNLGGALSKSVVIVATSDEPALMRVHAGLAAMAITEYFRDRGMSVALLFDSVTRYAMALREIGLAVGEPPTSRGYTPSVFAALPRILERAGPGKGLGATTAFYTVLVEGDDLNEPISDHARALLDGHIVLSREMSQEGLYPPIDLLRSSSRLIGKLMNTSEASIQEQSIAILAQFERSRDMVDFGAHKPGVNPELDKSIRLAPEIKRYFRQRVTEKTSREKVLSGLAELLVKV